MACDECSIRPTGDTGIGPLLQAWLDEHKTDESEVVSSTESDGRMPSYCAFYAGYCEWYRDNNDGENPYCDDPIYMEGAERGCTEWMGECVPV